MAPSSSPDQAAAPPDGDVLLDLAERAIVTGFNLPALPVPPEPAVPEHLQAPRGAFVTLHVDGRLNGCIGAVATHEPLPVCIDRLARAAAFDDPRLPALRPEDLPHLEIEVSLLSPLEPIGAGSRAELLAAVQPGVHGLVIGVGGRQGLFLPDVWRQLPDPQDFLDHLLAKAGLPQHGWPVGAAAWRFTTTAYARSALADRAD